MFEILVCAAFVVIVLCIGDIYNKLKIVGVYLAAIRHYTMINDTNIITMAKMIDEKTKNNQ